MGTPDYQHTIQQLTSKKTNMGFIQRKHPEFYEWMLEQTTFLPQSCSATQRLWHLTHQLFVPVCESCGGETGWDGATQTYRRYCSKACAGAGRRSHQHADRPVCARDGCNHLVNKNTNIKQWRQCCSRECHSAMQASVRVDPADVISLINNLPIGYDMTMLMHQHRALFNTVYDMTAHLPTSYQISNRVAWIIGDVVTKRELLAAAKLELGGTSDDSVRELKARVYTEKVPLCIMCSNIRAFNTTTSRYSKYCSDECRLKHTERVKKNKADRQLRKQEPRKAPSNKNTSWQLNDPDWLYNAHHVDQHTKQHIASIFGVDKETVTNRFKQFNIESIRHSHVQAERDIVQFIQTFFPGEVQVNNRSVISPRELDIFIPSVNLAIEYCGLYWHSDRHDRIDRNYHSSKYRECAAVGVRLITIFEDEWLHTRSIVEHKLRSIMRCSIQPTVYARNTMVVPCTVQEKREFLNQHHIQGDGPGRLNLSLRRGEQIVAVMCMQDRGDGEWILNRFATSAHIPGGFSKLLKFFCTHYVWTRILTFADLRWSTGNLYDRCGFVRAGIVRPDYSYVVGTHRIHKFNFRHARLAKRLPMYDPSLSETENTRANNTYRIWDCGKLRFELVNQ